MLLQRRHTNILLIRLAKGKVAGEPKRSTLSYVRLVVQVVQRAKNGSRNRTKESELVTLIHYMHLLTSSQRFNRVQILLIRG